MQHSDPFRTDPAELIDRCDKGAAACRAINKLLTEYVILPETTERTILRLLGQIEDTLCICSNQIDEYKSEINDLTADLDQLELDFKTAKGYGHDSQ